MAREITREDGHEFREYVHPRAEELQQLREEKRPFEYELSTKLLGIRYAERREATEEGSAGVEDVKAHTGSAAMGVLESTNDLLREELKAKNDQIRQLNDSLRAMQHQQNATNVSLVRLSERIPMLSEGTPVKAEGKTRTGDANVVAEETVEGKKAQKQRARKPKTRRQEGGGVLSKLFWSAVAKAASAK
jgi:hypothetical protein